MWKKYLAFSTAIALLLTSIPTVSYASEPNDSYEEVVSSEQAAEDNKEDENARSEQSEEINEEDEKALPEQGESAEENTDKAEVMENEAENEADIEANTETDTEAEIETDVQYYYYVPYEDASYSLIYYIDEEDEGIHITGCDGTAEGELVIPSEIDGKSVVIIEGGAFYGCSGFSGNLVIPDSVTYIGDRAFYDCAGIWDIEISENIEHIGSYAFAYYGSDFRMVKKITVKSSTVEIDFYGLDYSNIIYGYSNSTVEEYTKDNGCNFIPLDNLPEIEEYYVSNSDDLEDAIGSYRHIIVADGVYNIGTLGIFYETNLSIEAENPGKVELLTSKAFMPAIAINSSIDITLSGCIIGRSDSYSNTNDRNFSDYAVYIYNSRGVDVGNCDLYGMKGAGFYCVDAVNVRDCVIRDVKQDVIAGRDIYDLNFSDCIISGNASDSDCGSDFAMLSCEGNVSFNNCLFMNNYNTTFDENDNVVLSDCAFYNNAWDEETPQPYGICLNGITWQIEGSTLKLGYPLQFDEEHTRESTQGRVLNYSEFSIPWKNYEIEEIQYADDIEEPDDSDDSNNTDDKKDPDNNDNNDNTDDPGNEDVIPDVGEHITGLSLDKTSVKMHPGDTEQVTATIEPEDIQAEIVWESSNESVATVNSNGLIRAIAVGSAQITAECNGIEAVVRVDVIKADVIEEISDISGDIRIDGFKRESNDFVYTGQKITQNIKVYHNSTLLKEKTDYTLSYKNNVNAAEYNTAKAPSVTITLKGQYSGSVTLYYTIKPVDINDINVYNTGKDDAPGYEQAVAYGKNIKIPNPELSFGKQSLKVNKDFVCDYSTLPADYKKGDSYEAGKTYEYTVTGIGNFTGSIPMKLVVVKDKGSNFNSASVTLGKKQYEYSGTALTKSEVTIEALKLNKKVLDRSLYDYEVFADEIDGACIMVYPTEAGSAAGYHGSKKVNLKLVGDRNIKDAALGESWKESMTFSQTTVNDEGGIFQAKTGVLTFGTGTEKEILTEGEDYTVKYSNAGKAGNVTVTFTGKGRYKGTLKKKYVIKPNSDNDFTIKWKNVNTAGDTLEINYQKGGAVPEFELKDQDDNVLKNKTDYTVKLTNNKTPGTTMSCAISGKGNYKGYTKTVQIKVTNGNIAQTILSIPDKPYSTKADAWKSKVTIKDVNGKKLAAGKDYVKEVVYEYTNMGSVQYPEAGTTVTVTVTGMGSYEGSKTTGTYRIYKNSISKLKITIDAQEYTGQEIKLDDSDIHVYASSADAKKKNEFWEYCYEIDENSYKNNIKAGTAKVTLRGMGDYGGTKTYSFKIKKKAYLVNNIKKITLNETSLSISLQEKGTTGRTLTASIIPEDYREDITNPTVIWSTSNSKIATVESTGIFNSYDNTVKGIITPIKEGSVTITATTQDGKKKAQCKVKIVNAPVLIEAGQTIEGEPGDTYQLNFETDESGEVNLKGVEFESSNPEAISVDAKGLITMHKTGAAVIKVYAAKRAYVQQCYAVVKGEEEDIPESFYIFRKTSDSNDDTTAIRNAIYHANQTTTGGVYMYDGVYISAGVYFVDATANLGNGIFLDGREGTWNPLHKRDKFEIRMSPGTLLITKGNGLSEYRVICIAGCSNITISGGTLVGERNEHTSTGGEGGFGIAVYDSTNIHIDNMDISQCWGDGIYLGSAKDTLDNTATSSYITITNCNVHHNRRSNLSIVAADYVTIDECQFNYAKGTNPQYGIDIETNNRKNPNEHIKIYNTKMLGNAKASMGIITVANDIRLENCTLDGAFYNEAGTNIVLKNTTIKGTITDKTGGIRRE